MIDRVREAIETLEAIAADRGALADVPEEIRARLQAAVARVFHPDRIERRRMSRAADRERRAARVRDTEVTRAEAGIRVLRRKPVYHTPNVFPPSDPGPAEAGPHEEGAHDAPASEA